MEESCPDVEDESSLYRSNGHNEAEEDSETTPLMLDMVSCVLERLVARNDDLGLACTGVFGEELDVFDGSRPPNISVKKYLERIYRYSNCSPSCLVVGFVYIDRLVHKHPSLVVRSLNVHRLLVTSIMVASKVLEDVHHTNSFYAKIAGISKEELNKLELELLFLLEFGVTVTTRVFESYCQYLEKEMISNSALKSERMRPVPAENGKDSSANADHRLAEDVR